MFCGSIFGKNVFLIFKNWEPFTYIIYLILTKALREDIFSSILQIRKPSLREVKGLSSRAPHWERQGWPQPRTGFKAWACTFPTTSVKPSQLLHVWCFCFCLSVSLALLAAKALKPKGLCSFLSLSLWAPPMPCLGLDLCLQPLHRCLAHSRCSGNVGWQSHHLPGLPLTVCSAPAPASWAWVPTGQSQGSSVMWAWFRTTQGQSSSQAGHKELCFLVLAGGPPWGENNPKS